MEWLRRKLQENIDADDRRGAYAVYMGALEGCIRARDMEMAEKAMKIANEVLWGEEDGK